MLGEPSFDPETGVRGHRLPAGTAVVGLGRTRHRPHPTGLAATAGLAAGRH